MRRLLAVLLALASPAWADYTLDAAFCASSNPLNCPTSGTVVANAVTLTLNTSTTDLSGEVAIAVVSARGVGSNAITVAETGSGVYSKAWTRIKQCVNGTAAVAEVWGAITAQLGVLTATSAGTGSNMVFSVFVFRANGVDHLPSNFACATGSGTAAAVSITPQALNSFLAGAGADSAVATARTFNGNTTKMQESGSAIPSNGDTWTDFKQHPTVGSAISIGTTAPTTSTVWAHVVAEVPSSNVATAMVPVPLALVSGSYPGSSAASLASRGGAKVPFGACGAYTVTTGGTNTCGGTGTSTPTSRFGKALR